MTNRHFTFAAAFSVVLSATLGSLTPSLAQQAAPAGATAAADSCQTSPKGAAPQGKHWYYHLERSSGRKCWYLGQAGLKTTTSSAAKHKSAPAADSDATASPPPAPQNAAETSATTEPTTDNNATTQPAPETAAAMPAATPLLTERWPAADAFHPSETTTGQSATPANAQPATPEAPVSALVLSETTPAANIPPSDQAADLTPWRVILGVSFIVLVLIAVLALVTFRYFWRTNDAARMVPGQRRNIWENDEAAAAPSPSYADMVAPTRRTPARTPQDLDEIEQLLRRAAREPHSQNVISLADSAIRARTPTAPSAARASAARHAGSFRPR
jgi:hypothetical protein